jgi:glycosyltransferase involved in cell wall biosynthesis
MTDVSVVIPVRNGAATLGAQLAALAGQVCSVPFEVLVVDNGSTDATVAVARSFADRLALRVIDATERPGINVARNAGARAAAGSLLLFCDADDLVAPGWVQAMWAASAQAEALGGALDETSLNDVDRYGRDSPAARDGLPVGLGFLPYPVGANCGVKADIYREVGGFDETYAGGGDEVDFFWRVQLAGHALGWVPDAVVAYRHRVGARDNAKQAYRYGIAKVRLYADYRERGAHRDTPTETARAVAGLVRRLPDLGHPDRRLAYVIRAAGLAGQVRGSMRFRVLHLAR